MEDEEAEKAIRKQKLEYQQEEATPKEEEAKKSGEVVPPTAEKVNLTALASGDFTDEIGVGSLEDYAYGSIIGAFTGDACGSFNEFCPHI